MFVLRYLALKKPASEQSFFGNALRREHIDVAELVFALAKVLHLDPAFVDEGFETVVEAAGTDAQLFGDLALRHVGVALQHAQHPKSGVFLQLRAAAGHVLGDWARYRSAVSRSASAVGMFAQGKRFVQFWMIVGVYAEVLCPAAQIFAKKSCI